MPVKSGTSRSGSYVEAGGKRVVERSDSGQMRARMLARMPMIAGGRASKRESAEAVRAVEREMRESSERAAQPWSRARTWRHSGWSEAERTRTSSAGRRAAIAPGFGLGCPADTSLPVVHESCSLAGLSPSSQRSCEARRTQSRRGGVRRARGGLAMVVGRPRRVNEPFKHF